MVIFGTRTRQRELIADSTRDARALLLQVGRGELEPEEIPELWPHPSYVVPASGEAPEHFYRVTLEPEQFGAEIRRLQGLWPQIEACLGAAQQPLRPPARALSRWHLALALAAGAISGVVRSQSGRLLIVKGDTHKEKALSTEYSETEDGTVLETRILTDRFVPTIRAWDMTEGSETFGHILTIR